MKKTGLVAVFCDLDETLYPHASMKSAAMYLMARGFISRWQYFRVVWWFFLRTIGRLNHERAFAAGVQLLAGAEEQELRHELSLGYTEKFSQAIDTSTRAFVAGLADKGQLVLATESLWQVAQPFANDLGFTEVLATRAELDAANKLTGKLIGKPLRGDVKLTAIKDWANVHSVDLRQSWAVGGRLEDVPMLELVGNPIVFRPDAALRREALKRHWPIIES